MRHNFCLHNGEARIALPRVLASIIFTTHGFFICIFTWGGRQKKNDLVFSMDINSGVVFVSIRDNGNGVQAPKGGRLLSVEIVHPYEVVVTGLHDCSALTQRTTTRFESRNLGRQFGRAAYISNN
jgi:hypothetical protein